MEKRISIGFTVLLMLLSLGCTGEVEPEEPREEVHDFESCVEAGNPVMESHPRKCRADGIVYVEELGGASGEPSEDAQAVAMANNQFAFDMYEYYGNESGNVFFSPYSISTALAMTYEGAKAETAQEIMEVFNYPEKPVLRDGSHAIYQEINRKDKGYKLHTANALWAERDYHFLESYFDTITTYYGGNIKNMDFRNKPDDSRTEINDWVELQTEGKIRDLIPPGVINPMTRLVLTNAIYFKGTWETRFNETLTEKASFTTPAGSVDVDMMERTGKEAEFNYFEDSDAQIIELPYSGEDLSMLVILPKGNLADVESNLDAEKLSMWMDSLEMQQVDLFLPKFKFETKYLLKGTLSDMGMPIAFNPGKADFTGMDGTNDLFISNVIHQAFVEVNEEGTEAAAATAVVIEATAIPIEETPVFRADHPFIFVIQQKNTGNILFMGKVNDPTKG